MTIRVSLSRRNILIALAVFGVLIASLALLLNPSVRSKQNETKYYKHQLSLLKDAVHTIDSLNKREGSKASLADQVKAYDTGLTDILRSCREMDKHHDTTENNPSAQSLKPHIDQVKKLCADLEKVTEYAQKQSEATRDFIVFPSLSLTKQENHSGFQSTLDQTKSRLEQLRQDPINDPAVPEQLTLLQQLQQILPNTNGDKTKLDELAQKAQLHQTNFLNARTYYWNNTIGIEAIDHSLARLQEQFKPIKN